MKTRSLTIVLLFACLGGAFSQTSNMENRQWMVVSGPSFGSPDITTHTYKTEGLVELDGQYYSRIWIDSGSNGTWNSTGHLFREDSLKRIYYRSESAIEERLHCDFTVEKGDITTIYVHGDICVGVVDSVDFVETLDGGLRKRILFEPRFEYDGNYYWENVWLEGAGSTHGPLTPFTCFTDYDSWLLCYFEEEEQVFGSLGNCIVLSEESVPTAAAAVLYPNPTSNLVHIKTEERILSTEIWNTQGVRLQYTKGNWSELSLEAYAPGVYLFRIRYANGQQYDARVVRVE
jgi:hypothetical protein